MRAAEYLVVAKSVARHLWAELHEQRRAAIWETLTTEGRSVVEPTFAAAMNLFERESIYAEPGEHAGEYLLLYPGGQKVTVSTDQLLMMGGQNTTA